MVGLISNDLRSNSTYCQPFILQPEIGILGFLLSRSQRDVRLLVQFKTEPGNLGGAQLSPSFQCTESNYRGLHGGVIAPFREIFTQEQPECTLLDSLQSEQGTRFINKYNRNTVIVVDPANIDLRSPALAAWRWLTVREIGFLLTQDFIFNTDARSVISSLPWVNLTPSARPFSHWLGSDCFGRDLALSFADQPSPARIAAILSWLSAQRESLQLNTSLGPIETLPGWHCSPSGIKSESTECSLSIRYYRVHAEDREVAQWTQPLVAAESEGLNLLVTQQNAGVLRFAVRLSTEPGFANFAQLSTTEVLPPGSSTSLPLLPQLIAEIKRVDPTHQAVIFDCKMSEEGGRFYQNINRYVVLHLPAEVMYPKSDDLIWLTLGEIEAIKQNPGIFTNEFRSTLSFFVSYL